MGNPVMRKEVDQEFAEILKKMTQSQKVSLRKKLEDLLQNPLYVDDQYH